MQFILTDWSTYCKYTYLGAIAGKAPLENRSFQFYSNYKAMFCWKKKHQANIEYTGALTLLELSSWACVQVCCL